MLWHKELTLLCGIAPTSISHRTRSMRYGTRHMPRTAYSAGHQTCTARSMFHGTCSVHNRMCLDGRYNMFYKPFSTHMCERAAERKKARATERDRERERENNKKKKQRTIRMGRTCSIGPHVFLASGALGAEQPTPLASHVSIWLTLATDVLSSGPWAAI